MKFEIPNESRVIILEGIAGSGKTTFKGYLKEYFKGQKVYEYTEGELLLGWKHIHVPHVSVVRVDFFELFLDHLEKKLKEDKNVLFLIERFHLSMKILEWEFERDFEKRYERIISRIRQLPVHILIAKLEPAEIRKRMHHRERSSQWEEFVEEKLILRGFDDLEQLSIDQQQRFFSLAEQQGMPYSAVHVELDK
ncbi:AAA family ATPase [bacterium]|nr:AAA family ATPase [bacterium]